MLVCICGLSVLRLVISSEWTKKNTHNCSLFWWTEIYYLKISVFMIFVLSLIMPFIYWKLICFFPLSKRRVTHGIVGYALCFYTYSTWQGRTLFLEDLYVKPDYRTHGIGKLIFTQVAKFAKSMNCKRLELHVLDWNPARFFYDKLGGVDLTNLEGWNYYRFNQQAIESLANDNN